MTRLSAIFATGMVAAQRKNYALCMAFLERLAGVGGEEKRPRIRVRLLAQPSVAEFKSRWNLPIYFQLRWAGEDLKYFEFNAFFFPSLATYFCV